MIIATVVINICYFSLATSILLFSFFNKVNKKRYDVVTSSSKRLISLDIVLLALSSMAIVLGLVLILLFPKNDYIILLPSIGAIYGFLGLILLFIILNQFEAIKDSTIYVRRFIKIKEIPIDEVYAIHTTLLWKTLAFSDKYGDKLFSMDTFTFRKKEFFLLINERKTKFICSDVLEIDSKHKDERVLDQTLVDIGKEYRKNYYKRRKTLKTLMVIDLVCTAVSIFLAALFLDFINSPISFSIDISIGLTLVYGIFRINRVLRQMQHEISKDDEWVGGKHKYEDKRVIGYHKHKAKIISFYLLFLSMIMLPSAVVLPYSYNQKPYKEEDLVSVYGTIEYFGLLSNGTYVLAFEDNPVEYQISQSQLLYVGLEFYQLKVGTNVYLLTDKKDPSFLKRKDTDRKERKVFYVLKAPLSTEYVSYENYCQAVQRNRKTGLTIGYSLLAIGATSLLAIPVVCFTIGNYKKAEYIRIRV